MKDDVFFEEIHTTFAHYETERNKPIPNRIHGTIQSQLFELRLNYRDKFDIADEVSLDVKPGATPDLCIFEKKILDWKTTNAKESDMPITTVEIVSPSQSMDEMAKKVWDSYFPAGIKSAWIVIPPPFKAIYVLTPDGKQKIFDSGMLKYAVTGIEVDTEKVFAGMK